MLHEKVSNGKNLPEEFNVIIEIPANSGPVKYEIDKESGSLVVDRFMATPMFYPVNYGYVPHTLSEDGDPVDVLVWTPVPLLNCSVIACRALGMLNMEDESGRDTKIFAVPIDKLSVIYRGMKTLDDVPAHLLAQINHFFEHYKDLEAGKWVKVEGWAGPDQAKAEIVASVKRYQDTLAAA